MKILVVSDNHGNKEILEQISERFAGKVDGMFHCGDSELVSIDAVWNHFTAKVSGNCDFDPGYPISSVTKIGDETIYMTHGHRYDVRFGLKKIGEAAQEAGATICLYGHTHIIDAQRHGNILFVNPGSISQPRGKLPYRSFAIIEADSTQYKVTYYDDHFEEIPNLHFIFTK
ncbi:metallophosphoesterase [Enterococcus timonensis]|uniref:metallophosphoesterase n=1 Tax=Enterococcus timonensis TaxID=1852364 RepID=UPI0008DA74A6|nr:metallophosphoesterase [Enterococcus timonensis]